jgi:pimeloyl-ACP methyl ester carboxylesterase
MNPKRSRPGPALAAALIGIAAVAAAFYFKPLPALEDKALLRSDASVRVAAGPIGLSFLPAAGSPAKTTGIVIYCGERVPPEAYAYLARSCAAAGYTAVLAAMPLNFPALAPSKAAAAVAAYPGVTRWVIAGYSQGGAAAASFIASNAASKEPMPVAGLLLLASFPGRGVDLSTKSLPVVTVGATLDAIAPPAEIAAARDRLPAGSRYVEIAGGNHAQFGEYGPQTGDGLAEIPGPTQRRAAVDEALALLDRLDAGAGK